MMLAFYLNTVDEKVARRHHPRCSKQEVFQLHNFVRADGNQLNRVVIPGGIPEPFLSRGETLPNEFSTRRQRGPAASYLRDRYGRSDRRRLMNGCRRQLRRWV